MAHAICLRKPRARTSRARSPTRAVREEGGDDGDGQGGFVRDRGPFNVPCPRPTTSNDDSSPPTSTMTTSPVIMNDSPPTTHDSTTIPTHNDNPLAPYTAATTSTTTSPTSPSRTSPTSPSRTSPTSPTSPSANATATANANGKTSSRRSSLSDHVAHWKHVVDDKLTRARPYVERLSGTYEPMRREASRSRSASLERTAVSREEARSDGGGK